jgi:hypothetical protein
MVLSWYVSEMETRRGMHGGGSGIILICFAPGDRDSRGCMRSEMIAAGQEYSQNYWALMAAVVQ